MTETVQVEPEKIVKENGTRRLNETVVLPKKGKLRYRLIDFAGRRNIIVERKPTDDGRYRSEKYKFDCPIDGSALFNGGTEAWIDVNRGVQITNFDGITEEWVGIDGRFSYRAEVGKQWALIQAAKLGDLMKYAKIVIALVLVAVASPFLALLLKGS